MKCSYCDNEATYKFVGFWEQAPDDEGFGEEMICEKCKAEMDKEFDTVSFTGYWHGYVYCDSIEILGNQVAP